MLLKKSPARRDRPVVMKPMVSPAAENHGTQRGISVPLYIRAGTRQVKKASVSRKRASGDVCIGSSRGVRCG